MTEGERASFNQALDKVRKAEWQRHTFRKLDYKIDSLGCSEAIALMRKIEELL